MFYIHCYRTETSMIMNCDAGATIALSLLLTTNATLFTDKHINTVTKRFPYIIIIIIIFVYCRLTDATEQKKFYHNKQKYQE